MGTLGGAVMLASVIFSYLSMLRTQQCDDFMILASGDRLSRRIIALGLPALCHSVLSISKMTPMVGLLCRGKHFKIIKKALDLCELGCFPLWTGVEL